MKHRATTIYTFRLIQSLHNRKRKPMKYPAIAHQLGMSLDAIKKLLWRFRKSNVPPLSTDEKQLSV